MTPTCSVQSKIEHRPKHVTQLEPKTIWRQVAANNKTPSSKKVLLHSSGFALRYAPSKPDTHKGAGLETFILRFPEALLFYWRLRRSNPVKGKTFFVGNGGWKCRRPLQALEDRRNFLHEPRLGGGLMWTSLPSIWMTLHTRFSKLQSRTTRLSASQLSIPGTLGSRHWATPSPCNVPGTYKP